MTKDIVKINYDRTISDAIKLIVNKKIGCLLITKFNLVVGIITEKDLVYRVLIEFFDYDKVKISDVMTTPIFSISSEKSLVEAANVMIKYKIRHLPVIDNNKLVGLITSTTLLKTLSIKYNKELLIAATKDYNSKIRGPYQ